MFGLTFEKLIVIAIIAAVVIGPQRLPGYAEKLARLVRSFRDFADAAKARAESELGVPLETSDWNARLQQYDPRRIVREALEQSDTARIRHVSDAPAPHDGADARGDGPAGDQLAAEEPSAGSTRTGGTEAAGHTEAGRTSTGPDASPEGTGASAIRPRERWVVVGGSSGHPRRVRVTEPVSLANVDLTSDPAPDPVPDHPGHELPHPEVGPPVVPATRISA